MVAADVTQVMETTKLGRQVEILDPAQMPLAPVRPNRLKILLAALLLGPVAGVALAMLAEMLDSTLRSVDDFARAVPEPILGTTPLLTHRVARPVGRLRRHWIPATMTASVLVLAVLYLGRDRLVERFAGDTRPALVLEPE
jgi:hypothetical protein